MHSKKSIEYYPYNITYSLEVCLQNPQSSLRCFDSKHQPNYLLPAVL